MASYYNEIDPFAAAWLRELIKAGAIAEGDVDERSIELVRPDDLRGYTQCHFFAGIGGWSYALRLAGWPDDHPVWTGSCPCQPFSAAGKGGGTSDARHLWPQFRRLIRQCRPAVVFGEQVASKAGRVWLSAVFADLEALAYRAAGADLCGPSVGAWDIRQRLFFVADTEHAIGRALDIHREDGRDGPHGGRQEAHGEPGTCGEVRKLADVQVLGRGQGAADASRGGEGTRAEGAGLRPADYGGGDAFWADVEWLPCTDGKWRPTQPGLFPLAHGLQSSLALVRSIEREAAEEVIRYGDACQADSGEILRVVRKEVHARARGETSGLRVCGELHAPEILLNFLLCVETARDRAADKGGWTKASAEAHERTMRGVREHARNYGPPCRWESAEQCADESTGSLCVLSRFLARHAEAHRQATIAAHAAATRVGQLRGYGNAIKPQVAAAFIEAYVEAAVRVVRE